MGTMQHHAIVVTSWQQEGIEAAHGLAQATFPWVSPLSPEVINGYLSFFIPPDGSKDGWSESLKGDNQRDRFIEGLQALLAKELYTEWAEVSFGELGYAVERSSEENVA